MADSRELAFQNQVLSAVMLSRYNLKKKRTQDLKLREGEGKYLTGITGVGSGKPKESEFDLLSHIIEKMNALFGKTKA